MTLEAIFLWFLYTKIGFYIR